MNLINNISISLDIGCKLNDGNLNNLLVDPMVSDYAVSTLDKNGKFVISLDKSYHINFLRIYNRANIKFITQSPNHIQISGKININDEWIPITDISNTNMGEYFDIAINKSYKYIYLYTITNNGWNSNCIAMRKLELYGVSNKYLIKQQDKYYSIKPDFYSEESDLYDPQLITDLSISKFESYGIDDLSSIHSNALNKLIDNKYNIAMLK